jgi:aspartyl-tRNA(Asn)/glutamyl-tRNA(Gln) amidotransferase subunit A
MVDIGAPSDIRARVVAALDRIDPDLGAFITVDADAALRRAVSVGGGRLRGTLVGVKDLIDTAGLRTTYGSPRFRYHVPTATAPVIARLEREGAIVLGKTNLNEFAFGVSGYNPHYGLMRVPHAPDRTPGGSSGGSAIAVAAGVCDLAVGTDTGGSVRIPAACCGILGFKCANGAVSMAGVHPLAPEHDSIGYFTRTIELLQQVLRIPELPPVSALRVAEVEDLPFPDFPAEAHWTVFREHSRRIHASRAARHPGEYGKDLHVKLAKPVGDVDHARGLVATWASAVRALFRTVDLVVLPVFPGEPPAVEDVLREYDDGLLTTSDRLLSVTPIANALGWPALAVPTEHGPRQVLGPPGREAEILAVGRLLQWTGA